jgi:hypothetical protein
MFWISQAAALNLYGTKRARLPEAAQGSQVGDCRAAQIDQLISQLQLSF